MSATSLSPAKTAQYLNAATQAESHGPAMHAEGITIPETETFIAAELALGESLERDVLTLSPELGLSQERGLDTPILDTATELGR